MGSDFLNKIRNEIFLNNIRCGNSGSPFDVSISRRFGCHCCSN